MEQAPVKTMLEVALPVMRELTVSLGQSCHVAVRSGNDIVVIARMESAENIGFSVRIGHRKAIAVTASGAILYAFQQESVRESWLSQIAEESHSEAISQLKARANLIRERGYERTSSKSVRGLTDISAPILRGTTAAAALTVPFVHFIELSVPITEAISHLMAAAAKISASLLLADRRV
jgi:DNA-binding IclR family transcriptional regulator